MESDGCGQLCQPTRVGAPSLAARPSRRHSPTGTRWVRPAGMSDGRPDRPIVHRTIQSLLPVGTERWMCTQAGAVVFGLLKPQALLAAPNATAVYASPDLLGVSKSRRAAPAAAVIASGGACGGLLVPRVASAFQITRPGRRPSMPPSDMPVWTGLASQHPAGRRRGLRIACMNVVGARMAEPAADEPAADEPAPPALAPPAVRCRFAAGAPASSDSADKHACTLASICSSRSRMYVGYICCGL
jgi:hypothetical protein